LEQTQQRWQQAADLAYGGDVQKALELLAEDYPTQIGRNQRGYMFLRVLRRLVEENKAAPNTMNMARWYFNMERPDLAAEVLIQIQEAQKQLDLFDRVLFSLALVESGRYGKAREAMVQLNQAAKFTNDKQWSVICDRWTEAISSLDDGQEPTIEVYRKIYLAPSPRWYCERLHPIIAVWHLPQSNASTFQKVRFLADFFARASDPTGQELTNTWIIQNVDDSTDRQAVADAMIALGSVEFKKREYQAALARWQRVKDDYPDTPAANTARDNITGYTSMSTARAGWRAANRLFANKDYADALRAFRNFNEKHLRHFRWGHFVCGNAVAQQQYEIYLKEAACLEYLGDYDEAARTYWQAAKTSAFHSGRDAHIQLVHLYQAADQIDDLKTMITALDERSVETVHRILEIGEMGNNSDWPGLIELLLNDRVFLPYEASYQIVRSRWEPLEAARILAAHPDKTVPLLDNYLNEELFHKMICYALGLCATDAAVAILAERARLETGRLRLFALIYGLSLAGSEGEAAIEDLAHSATDILRLTIEQYRTGRLPDKYDHIPFPDAPQGVKLPTNLSESARSNDSK
jgi:tetratricopeptide (TPR) repeat protein